MTTCECICRCLNRTPFAHGNWQSTNDLCTPCLKLSVYNSRRHGLPRPPVPPFRSLVTPAE